MAFSHNLSISWSSGGRSIGSNKSYAGAAQQSISEVVNSSTTDLEITISIDVSAMVMLVMKCDQDVTVETNSAGTPDDTIALKAKVPYAWNADNDSFTTKLTTDVAALFLTNAGATNATFELEVLSDPTP